MAVGSRLWGRQPTASRAPLGPMGAFHLTATDFAKGRKPVSTPPFWAQYVLTMATVDGPHLA
jgi:hypothetical protein